MAQRIQSCVHDCRIVEMSEDCRLLIAPRVRDEIESVVIEEGRPTPNAVRCGDDAALKTESESSSEEVKRVTDRQQ